MFFSLSIVRGSREPATFRVEGGGQHLVRDRGARGRDSQAAVAQQRYRTHRPAGGCQLPGSGFRVVFRFQVTGSGSQVKGVELRSWDLE
jgi:hypothetical protein